MLFFVNFKLFLYCPGWKLKVKSRVGGGWIGCSPGGKLRRGLKLEPFFLVPTVYEIRTCPNGSEHVESMVNSSLTAVNSLGTNLNAYTYIVMHVAHKFGFKPQMTDSLCKSCLMPALLFSKRNYR